jgi:hypothetical protein
MLGNSRLHDLRGIGVLAEISALPGELLASDGEAAAPVQDCVQRGWITM